MYHYSHMLIIYQDYILSIVAGIWQFWYNCFMTKKETEKLLPIFKKYPTVKLVYLFGSMATGKTGPLSDYDFAVYLDEKDSLKRFSIRVNLANDLSSIFKTDDIDLSVLNDIESPELKYNILKEGILIFEKEPYKVLVEPSVLIEYFDFHELLLRHQLTKG